jgi:hypothetical protein
MSNINSISRYLIAKQLKEGLLAYSCVSVERSEKQHGLGAASNMICD